MKQLFRSSLAVLAALSLAMVAVAAEPLQSLQTGASAAKQKCKECMSMVAAFALRIVAGSALSVATPARPWRTAPKALLQALHPGERRRPVRPPRWSMCPSA